MKHPFPVYDRTDWALLFLAIGTLGIVGGVLALGWLTRSVVIVGYALMVVAGLGGVFVIIGMGWRLVYRFGILHDNERRQKRRRTAWYLDHPTRPFPDDVNHEEESA